MSDFSRTLGFLRGFPDALWSHLDAVPSAALDFIPSSWEGVPSEALTIRQQICHLRDIEIDGYAVRFSRVLREDCPALPGVDTYALIESRDYDRADMRETIGAFAEARAANLRLLEAAKPDELSRAGIFEEYGRVTLEGLAHYLCSHDQQHLAGIQWLLGRFASAK